MTLTPAQARQLRARMAAEHHATRRHRTARQGRRKPLDRANTRRHEEAARRQVDLSTLILSDPERRDRLTPEQDEALRYRVAFPASTLAEIAHRIGCTKDTYAGLIRRALKAGTR